MIYEQRIYTCLPGRLPALLKRFEGHTLKIWEKHGIRQAGFWTVLIGNGNHDLHYLLAWESLAEREKKWGAFMADPAWISARADSEKRRADHRQHQEHDPAADGVFVGEVGWVKRSADPTPFGTLPASVGSSLTLEPTYGRSVSAPSPRCAVWRSRAGRR